MCLNYKILTPLLLLVPFCNHLIIDFLSNHNVWQVHGKMKGWLLNENVKGSSKKDLRVTEANSGESLIIKFSKKKKKKNCAILFHFMFLIFFGKKNSPTK